MTPTTPPTFTVPTLPDDFAAKAAGGFWLSLALVFLLYWLPSIIAAVRNRNLLRVVVLNFLGITVVCWVIALVLALQSKRPGEDRA